MMNKRKFSRMRKQNVAHVYPEAFKRMKYRCERCGKVEWIWNSRNGVTPFAVRSICCAGAFSSHINWQDDIYSPDHQPQSGDRIFAGEAERPKVVIFREKK